MTNQPQFEYSNHNPRPVSRLLKTASMLFPGIRQIQAHIHPYAEAWIAANTEALEQPYPLWVVLGDSMSQGVGASAHDKGWVGQLASQLAAEGHNYRIINLSISGARVDDVLNIQIPAMKMLGIRPALVTVLIGANNLMRSKHRAALVDDITELLEVLPEGSVIGTITGPSSNARQANRLIRAAAVERGFRVVNMHKAFKPPFREKLSQDYFHPNDIGYSEIAKAFKEVIDTI